MKSSLFWGVTQRRLVVTDVSGHPVGAIVKGQEDGTDMLSRNVGNYQCRLCNIPEERRPHRLMCWNMLDVGHGESVMAGSFLKGGVAVRRRGGGNGSMRLLYFASEYWKIFNDDE